MLILILGLTLFFLPHLLRELGLRQRVMDALPSQAAYKGVYSLWALAGLGLIIWGKAVAPFSMVWQPAFEQRYISHLLMLPVFVLIIAGNTGTSYISKYLRNPMLLGITLWGGAHLWANGDLASMILFGSFTLWGGFKFVMLSISNGPVTKPASVRWDITALIAGLFIYAMIFLNHGQLFGVGLSFD